MSGSIDRGGGGWAAVVAAVLVRPVLWPVAVRQGVRLVPGRWWARSPHLPVPSAGYVRFRSVTSSGGTGQGAPDPTEVVTWLRWCRSWPAAVGLR
jgi:hypothetical protein